MKRSPVVVFILLLVPYFIIAQDYIQKPAGSLKFLQNDDLKIHEKNGAYYNEHWAYHVVLDNGAEIYVTYSISHFAGLRNSVSSARLSLLNWKNNDYSVVREYDLNELVFNEEKYKMDLNPERGIWFEGKPDEGHRFYFRTQKDGIHYDISVKFDDPFKGFTLGDGIFKLGEHDETGIFTHIPFSRVSGFIALDYDTVKISGIGFMDHTYQTNIGTRLFEASYKFNQKTEIGFTGGHFMIPIGKSNEIAGYAYTYDGKNLKLKLPRKVSVIKRGEVMGQIIPTAIEIMYENGASDYFNFHDVKEKVSMLDELGGFKRMMAKRFLGGEILFYRGKARVNQDRQEVYFNLSIVN